MWDYAERRLGWSPFYKTRQKALVHQNDVPSLFGFQKRWSIVWIPSPAISTCAPAPTTSAALSNGPWSSPNLTKSHCSTTRTYRGRWLGSQHGAIRPNSHRRFVVSSFCLDSSKISVVRVISLSL
jgi:hypothetical protein